MKKGLQLLIIHGGMTFKSYKDYIHYLKTRPVSLKSMNLWSYDYLDEKLGEIFQIIRPAMPLKEYAKYREWKIVFERYFPYLKDNVILIGVSLGGIFLAKYLSENKFPKKILSLYLVSPPFDDTLPRVDLAGGFKLKKDLSQIEKNAEKIRIMFSEDDPVIPVSHAKKYKERIPGAEIIIYKSKRGHFLVERFPEIVRMLKGDLK